MFLLSWHLSLYLLHWHDDVIKWKQFPRYWPFVRGIPRSTVNSPHKGQWRGALMFFLICVWINGCVNNREAGDLRRHWAHYDVIVMNKCIDVKKYIFLLHKRVNVDDGLKQVNKMVIFILIKWSKWRNLAVEYDPDISICNDDAVRIAIWLY